MPYRSYSHRVRMALIVGPYLMVVLMGFVGLYYSGQESDRACRERRALNEAVRQVIDVATTPSGGGPVDLSKISGFAELNEPTQTYLVNLSTKLTAANEPGNPPLHDRLLALIPPIKC